MLIYTQCYTSGHACPLMPVATTILTEVITRNKLSAGNVLHSHADPWGSTSSNSVTTGVSCARLSLLWWGKVCKLSIYHDTWHSLLFLDNHTNALPGTVLHMNLCQLQAADSFSRLATFYKCTNLVFSCWQHNSSMWKANKSLDIPLFCPITQSEIQECSNKMYLQSSSKW